MSLTVSNSGGDFKTVEPGTYVARCIRLIDIGTQHGEYQGKPTVRKQVVIMWELPTELMTGGDYDGKPYTISRFYTASLNEKSKLRADLESWRGKPFTEDELKGFSLDAVLGQTCMLSIIQDANGKAKISGVSKIMKGMQCPALISTLICFDLDNFIQGDREHEQLFNEELSKGMRELVMKSEEYLIAKEGYITDNRAAESDDIPF